MMPCHMRAYTSEPPPGAVLITNSTGWVGCTEAAALPPPVGLGLAAGLAQAVRVMSAVARNATVARLAIRTSKSRYGRRCRRGHTAGLTATNPVTMAKAGRHSRGPPPRLHVYQP